MNRNGSKQLVITIMCSGIAMILGFLINFVLTPYITKTIGTEAYGFVSLANNFSNYALIVTIALNSYAARFITIEYHRGNKLRANQYYSSVFYGDIFLSGIIFIIASLFIFNLDKLLNISTGLIFSVKILFLLIFTGFFIVTSGNVFTSAAYIKNRLDLTGIFKVISYIVEICVFLMLFRFNSPRVWYVGIGLMAASVVVVFGNYILTRKLTPDLQLNIKNFSFPAVRMLVFSGVWNSINSLGNTLNSGLDLIICNLMLSALSMGQLAIAKTISVIFTGLYQLISQPFQPLFLKSYAENNRDELIRNFKFSMKLSGFFSNLAFAGFVSLGTAYYKLWIPNQDINLIYKLTVVSILTSVLEGAMYPLYYIYTLTIKNRIPCIITFIGGILNVGGMYFLIKYTNLGVYAVVWTTAVIFTFINSAANPIYMAHCLKVKWYTFYPVMFRHIISCFIMTFVFCSISNLINPQRWITLIFAILLCCISGVIIHIFILFNSSEKDRIFRFLQKN